MAESMQGLHRSHRCTEVSNANIGEKVTVMGWVQKRRNFGIGSEGGGNIWKKKGCRIYAQKRIPAVAVVHVSRYVRCVQFRCVRMKRVFYIHW